MESFRGQIAREEQDSQYVAWTDTLMKWRGNLHVHD